jgi:hypothetical protein
MFIKKPIFLPNGSDSVTYQRMSYTLGVESIQIIEIKR